jgi:penicillin-binding protein 2
VFARRVQWFVTILSLVAIVLIARLAQIQILEAKAYDQLGQQILTRAPRYLPAPRGTIFDRHGRPLLSDVPTTDISVRYEVLTFSNRRQYLSALARQLRKRGAYPSDMSTAEIVAALQTQVTDMWQTLAAMSATTPLALVEEGEAVRSRVERVRAVVGEPIREERAFHTVIEAADADTVLRSRLELADLPWLRVVPSAQRQAHDADTLSHLLGRTGEVSAERIRQDPLKDDVLRRLRPGDRCGVSGIERLAETTLRGSRGRVLEDFDGREIEREDPVAGSDVWLTLDHEIQQRAYQELRDQIEGTKKIKGLATPSGGAVVIIDVATREVLALTTYPTFAYADFSADYVALRQDTRRIPLRSRAISTVYAPGSTCKAITVVGGLSEGVITADQFLPCAPGHLLPNKPGRFRCWIFNQYGRTHKPQNASLAIKNSCNMYFYRVGDRLGAERLTDWFLRFGLGHTAGTGLIEESPGVVPTADWLRRYRPSAPEAQKADAWNWAIGQGEVSATPLQVANVAATAASGVWAPVRLVHDNSGNWLNPCDELQREFKHSALHELRLGMWRVVNERGTARNAKLESDEVLICGKTGSAQTVPHVVSYKYTLEFEDGRREVIHAPTDADAVASYPRPKPKIVGKHAAQRYPNLIPGEKLPVHGWFMGFTQSADTTPGERPRSRSIAICVMVEFGEGGARAAAPVAKRLLDWMVAGGKL